MKTQPAMTNYFFKDAYVDSKDRLISMLKRSFLPCSINAKHLVNAFYEDNSAIVFICSLITLILAIPISIISVLCSCIAFVFPIIAFSVITAILCLVILILRGIDNIVYFFRKISYQCTNCQNDFKLPEYVCPKCNTHHDNLIPGRYGILKRRCKCGKELSTMYINGRNNLPAVCPVCKSGNGAKIERNSRDICCIPIIGGRDAGKTCFISTAILELEKHFIAKKWFFTQLSSNNSEYADNLNRISKGVCPRQTGNMKLNYYRFSIMKKKNAIRNVVSICDIGGEAYSQGAAFSENNAQNITDQIGFANANGLIMLIDPLSIKEFRQKTEKNYDISEYRISTKPISDVLSIVTNTLENMLKLVYSDKISKNIAVVFTKCDAPGVDEEIGEAAMKNIQMSTMDKSKSEIQNQLCMDFLKKYGETNFLNILQGKFKHIQFFTSSALGHNENGEKFTPYGVEEPILWLLSQCKVPISLD